MSQKSSASQPASAVSWALTPDSRAVLLSLSLSRPCVVRRATARRARSATRWASQSLHDPYPRCGDRGRSGAADALRTGSAVPHLLDRRAPRAAVERDLPAHVRSPANHSVSHIRRQRRRRQQVGVWTLHPASRTKEEDSQRLTWADGRVSPDLPLPGRSDPGAKAAPRVAEVARWGEPLADGNGVTKAGMYIGVGSRR